LQRFQEQEKQKQDQSLKQHWRPHAPSLKQREKQHTQECLESFISANKIQVKPSFEHVEKCSSLKQHTSSSTVTDTVHKGQIQPNQTASTKSAQRNESLRMHKTYHEVSTNPKFRAGFEECARVAGEILNRFDGEDSTVSKRLLAHLALCLESLGNSNEVTSSSSDLRAGSTQTAVRTLPSASPSVLVRTSAALTLVPTKLPNGDLAFVIPARIKNSVMSCLSDECTRDYHANCGVRCIEEGKHLQGGEVWRPWWRRNVL
jgi:hypothetical protein